MRKIMFSVIILVALILAVEVGITLLSQHGMEKALSAQYELPSSLQVSINSFPYLVSLFRNHLGELQLSWQGELQYGVEEGAAANMPYACRVNLYDVELNMPSLLTGKLEIRNISRLKAFIYLETADINEALGISTGGFFVHDDVVFLLADGEKTQYKVKVTDDNTLSLEPIMDYMHTGGSPADNEHRVETVVFMSLPMDAKLSYASIEGERVVLSISIPVWEGYL